MDAIRLQTGQRIDKDGRGTPNLPSTTIAVVNQSIKAAFVTGHDGGDGVRERNLVSVWTCTLQLLLLHIQLPWECQFDRSNLRYSYTRIYQFHSALFPNCRTFFFVSDCSIIFTSINFIFYVPKNSFTK